MPEERGREGLPSGTVTFLFSDIEGSTRLLNRLGAEYPSVLETHQRLLREAFASGGGVEVSTEGDSFFVVFPAAPGAVAAAVAGQRALAGHAWPEGVHVRARMGLHTGEAVLGGDNYVGADVHRAARIASAGHGGQVLLSAAAAGLVEHALPEGVTLRDLGEHRLKDLAHPEHLYQVVAPGLHADFPPLRSLDVRPGNLPSQLTRFVGRRRELEEVKEALRRTRLLTLTGPGGTGKTRLSIQTASEMAEDFQDGAWFVPLSSITEPDLVPSTVAEALGVRENPARPPIEVLTEHLADKQVLLVLDNFEQVLAGAAHVGHLLTATEGVTVLTSSREPLGLHGEREYPVPPLGLPDIRNLPPLEALSQYESVALFIDRARAVRPGFEVTEENAPAMAEITFRLDGLPLAIELAAARSKVLSPQAMLSRLQDRLALLTGGARDLPARQQTLRGAIAWSYDLLDEEERALFARLSVFRGGFTLEAGEGVCDPDGSLGLDVLDGVTSLVNKSLVRQSETEHGEPRFSMLGTIRGFAAERLAELPEASDIHRRHVAFFLDLAERTAPELTGSRQSELLDLLDHEHDNFRAALDRASEDGDAASAMRLGGALWRFWQMRGHLREGRRRLEGILALPADDADSRARALEGAGGICYWMGDMDAAEVHYAEALQIRRDLGDTRDIAEAMYNLSFVHQLRSPEERDLERAQELLAESAALFREVGDQRGMANSEWGLANVLYELEDHEGALRASRRSYETLKRLDDRFGVAWAAWLLGVTFLRVERPGEARPAMEEALRILAGARDSSGVPLILGGLAVMNQLEGDRERAVRLGAAARALEAKSGGALTWATLRGWDVRGHGLVPEEDFERLSAEGEAMTMEEAVAHALERDTP